MAKQDVQKWAFIVGLVVALLAGFLAVPYVALILFIAGLIIGFLNINDDEMVPFLVAVIALGAIGSQSISVLSGVLGSGMTMALQEVVGNIIAFVGAAGIVVAIKAIYRIGKD